MTVVAALQPQDIQLIQANQRDDSAKDSKEVLPVALIKSETIGKSDSGDNSSSEFITQHQQQPSTSNVNMPTTWQSISTTSVADYLSRIPNALPMNLQQFLKFSAETIKRESQVIHLLISLKNKYLYFVCSKG